MVRFRSSSFVKRFLFEDDASFRFASRQYNNLLIRDTYYLPGHKHVVINSKKYVNYSNKLYLLPVVKMQSNRKLGTNFSYSDFYKLPIQFKH